MTSTYLGSKGYSIYKECLTIGEQECIRKDLTVKAFAPKSSMNQPTPFPIYRESPLKFYVPRFYGEETYGEPDENRLPEGKNIKLKFKGGLRDIQKPIVSKYLKHAKINSCGLIEIYCGAGKCLKKGTPVMLSNGRIRKVENIKIGDMLMGDDSTPRKVLSLARGREMMYDIIPTEGDTYTVNESHILSLKRNSTKFKKSDIVDISVKDYLKLQSVTNQGILFGYRVPVKFPEKKVEFDPYIMGCWLGSNSQSPIMEQMAENRHIPHDYKCNSREFQLELLAGIIDSCGTSDYNTYDIVQKNERFIDDIIFIARSLGFSAYKKKEDIYYKTCINGADIGYIPVKSIEKTQPTEHIKDTLMTRIKVVKKKVGDYYGFEIDGNRRFILGDFQVTHNTVMALNILAQLKKKTLIVVHKDFLLRQWKERIEQFLPGAKVGKIQGDIIDIDDKDIVIGMLQSLSMKEYPASIFKEFGFTIIDECFPYGTQLHTDKGLLTIGSLYEKYANKEELPNILSFNQGTGKFEYKKMTHAWRKERIELIKIKMSKRTITCTPDHKILTPSGYIEANKLKKGDSIMSKYDKNNTDNIILPALNTDQQQIVYASFLSAHAHIYNKEDKYKLIFTFFEKSKDYSKWKAGMFGITELKYSQIQNTKLDIGVLLNNLDERGIAIWYMDHVFISKLKDTENISICTNKFDYETQEKFVKKFNQYGINCVIDYDIECNIDCTIDCTIDCSELTKHNRLHFNKENTLKLLQLVKPYIHNSIKQEERSEVYKWDNKFLDYGILTVSEISYFKNEGTRQGLSQGTSQGLSEGTNESIKPYVYDIEVDDNHNFIIGSHPKYTDGPIVSNCHHISAEVFSRSLFKIVTKYMLGLSATMQRKDGLTKVFKQFLGPVVVKKERPLQDNVTVKAIDYYNADVAFSKVSLNYLGHTNYTIMIKKLCEFSKRSEFLLKIIKNLIKNGTKEQHIMVIGHNKSLLKYLYDAIEEREIAPVGYYIGGMKEKDLKISEGRKIIIATYAMAEEALDIKTLDTLIMATPKKDVRQAVGRILRNVEGQKLVIDIIDQHVIFKKHWEKRRVWYKKQKFKILRTDTKGYDEDKWEVFQHSKKKKSHHEVDPIDKLLNGTCLID